MKDFVVSDIHGCYLTLMKLLHKYYNESTMRLVVLGDFLDKGAYPYEMWKWFEKTKAKPNVLFLRGNHEQELIEYVHKGQKTCWYEQDGWQTIQALEKHKVDLSQVAKKFSELPLYVDTPFVFYSHAGVSIFKHDKNDPNDPCGLLWNRMTVQNLGKLQVYGHTPHMSGPIYQSFSQSYVIDTGVFLSGHLSALVIDEKGEVIEIYKEKTVPKDIIRREYYK